MPLTGSAAGPVRTLRLPPLVSLTTGELMASEAMSGADAAGYEPAVLIRRSALAWFPATGVRARARPGQEQDDRPGE
jgi:hypothetical protein